MAKFALIWLKLTVLTEIVSFAQKFENRYSIERAVSIDHNYGKCYFLKLTKRNAFSCLSECNRHDQCSSCAYSNDTNCFLYSYNKESNTGNASGILVNLYSKKCKAIIFLKILLN
jgi:hypothetical protein